MTTHHPPSRKRQLRGQLSQRHILALLIWWSACWYLSGTYFDRQIDTAHHRETEAAERFVAKTVEGFDRIISVRLGMIKLLARDATLRQTLEHAGPVARSAALPYEKRKRQWKENPTFAAANQHLKRGAEYLGVTGIGLFDSALNCIASSDFDTEKSCIGTNYADRDYAAAILAGQAGHQLTIGKVSGTVAFSLHAPVRENGKLLGAVVGRAELAPFGNWLATTDAFLTDRNGVVVLAHDETLALRALPDAPALRLDADRRQAIYRTAEIPPLHNAPWGDPRFPELRRIEGRDHPVIHLSQAVPASNEPVVHVLWPFPQLTEYDAQRRIALLASGSAGTLALLLGSALLARRRERQESQAELARRAQEYRSLAENIPDNIARWDTEGRYLYVNPTHARLLGALDKEIVGTVIPDTHAAVKEAIARVAASGQPLRSVRQALTVDGQVQLHDVSIVPEFDDDGDVVSVLGIGRDMTDIYRLQDTIAAREHEFRSLAESSPDYLIRYDREHHMRYLNDRLLRELKITNAAQVLGKRPIDVWPDGRFAVIDDAAAQAITSGSQVDIELAVPGQAGETDYRHICVVPERDARGEIVGTLAFGRDITQLKRAEAARESALAEAERLARMRGEFLAHMSHELRTPLNGILGHVQLLQAESDMHPHNAAALLAIRQNGEALLGMIEDILDLTRIAAGTFELRATEMSPRALLDDLAEQAQLLALRKGLTFTCSIDPKLPALVHADAARLRQVLLHLLDNAVKFTTRGGVELCVERPAPGRLRFIVRDTGIGIAAGDQERIFQPFAQLGELRQRASGGGLGLAIGRHLIELMGGELRVDSQPGLGSTFRFELPLPETSGELPAEPLPPTAALEEPLAADEIPSLEDLQVLHRLARQGDMRDIVRQATAIASREPRCARFALRLQGMAEGFQSKALVTFLATHLRQDN